MKKSKAREQIHGEMLRLFEAFLPGATSAAPDMTEWLLEKMEEAGVAWEPEEPLPKMLRASRGVVEAESLSGWNFIVSASPGDWFLPEQRRAEVLAEMVRRYNAFPELERLAEEAKPHGGYLVDAFTRRLCKILESGKP